MIERVLQEHAARSPDCVALISPGCSALTFGGLARQVESMVAQLNRFGVGRCDRVTIVLPNGAEMALAFLATASCAVAAPLNPAYRSTEFEFYLSDLEPKALLVARGQDSPARAVASALGVTILELAPGGELTGGRDEHTDHGGFAESSEAALLLHTSGTTSRPKLVKLTHANLCASAHNIRTALALTPEDRCLNVMPLFHIHGLIGALLSSLTAGASVVCTSGFDAIRFFGWLEEFRPTWYTAVPTMHQALLAQVASHADVIERCPLRLIRSCSAALLPRVMAELEAAFRTPVVESYGMTEASHQMTTNPLPPRVRKPGSVGLGAGTEVAILDDAGNLLAVGKIGEVAVRGSNVTLGYEHNPVANEASFTGGWFRTGDQGYLDHDAYLFLTGRVEEIINRGGEKISPREVDEVLLEHPAVGQAVMFGVPHQTLGQEVAAAVVLRPHVSVTGRELREFARERLAPFKVPRQILFVDELPKGATGKIERIGMSEKLNLREKTEAEFAGPRTELERELATIWAELLCVERVGVDDDFFQLGGDSLLAARLIARVEEVTGVDASELDLFDAPTVGNMGERIAARMGRT